MLGDESGDFAFRRRAVHPRQPGAGPAALRIVAAVVKQADRLLKLMQRGNHGFGALARHLPDRVAQQVARRRVAAGEMRGTHRFGANADPRKAGRAAGAPHGTAIGAGRNTLVRHVARRGAQRLDTPAERSQGFRFKRHRSPAIAARAATCSSNDSVAACKTRTIAEFSRGENDVRRQAPCAQPKGIALALVVQRAF